MKYINTFLAIIMLLFVIVSCTVKPEKINYGKDHCHYCDMTIVGKTHVSEYVTKKGKSYKFDAIECMIHNLNQEKDSSNLSFKLVSNFDNPGNFINAESATYLVSKTIRSPMGANLSAFSSKEEGEAAKKKYGGDLYTWQEIRTKLGAK